MILSLKNVRKYSQSVWIIKKKIRIDFIIFFPCERQNYYILIYTFLFLVCVTDFPIPIFLKGNIIDGQWSALRFAARTPKTLLQVLFEYKTFFQQLRDIICSVDSIR